MPDDSATYRYAAGAQPFGPYKVALQVRRNDVYEQYEVALDSGVRLGLKSLSPQLAPSRDALAVLVEPFSVGLLSVLDFGAGERGGDALVVTEPTGTTLRERLTSGEPLPPAQALSALRDMARALTALEVRGLPMPTVSPEGVCLRQDGVRLDDYFLPLLFEGRRVPPNFFLARYSAPESDRTGPNSRATLFSLGMVFYEMLVGRHAFAGSVYEAIAAIRTNDVDLSFAPATARPLLSRLVARNPDERFASLAELSGVFAGESVTIDSSEWAATGSGAAGGGSKQVERKGPKLEPLGVNEFGRPEFRRSQDGGVMILVPGGVFTMGSAAGGEAERPPVEVQVEPFLIDKYPVTWAAFVSMHAGHDESCEFCAVRRRVLPSRYLSAPMNQRATHEWSEFEKLLPALNDAVSASGGENLPVTYLTWREMERYAELVGTELPSEAEWEYADRAGTPTRYPWGVAKAADHAWYEENSGGVPHPVGQKRPNPWGLHDMNGNVLEMCRDRFLKEIFEMVASGAASAHELAEGVDRPGSRRSARGGAFSSTADGVTASFRVGAAPEMRSEVRGFRCVIRRGHAPEWAKAAFAAR